MRSFAKMLTRLCRLEAQAVKTAHLPADEAKQAFAAFRDAVERNPAALAKAGEVIDATEQQLRDSGAPEPWTLRDYREASLQSVEASEAAHLFVEALAGFGKPALPCGLKEILSHDLARSSSEEGNGHA